jgi:hypothetical protein
VGVVIGQRVGVGDAAGVGVNVEMGWVGLIAAGIGLPDGITCGEGVPVAVGTGSLCPIQPVVIRIKVMSKQLRRLIIADPLS